ncbi:MAG: tripartite tricarboxylate transporter substrate binding protein [Xanthobacteraceae bacterium]|jgi:tripartite-type tricarboxylate transporter receptor subunit TctC
MSGARAALRAFFIGFAASLLIGPVSAQEGAYPGKPIRIIVGFGAGGGNDLFARLIGQKLSERVGQPVIIENKPGAGGRLAVEYATSQPGDGYTLVLGASGAMAVTPAIYPRLAYHPTRTFRPLTMVASFPLILVASMQDAITSVDALVGWGKANPEKSNYGTSSPAFTIATELFKLKTGMPAQAIPYKSSNESLLGVAGGQTLFTIADGPPVVPLVHAAKVRALAVTGSARSSELPHIPAMAEVGLPDVDIRLWSGFFVLASTPAAVAGKLESELRRALADAGVRDKLKTMAVDPDGGSGEDFSRTIERDVERVGEIVRAANLKFED